MTNQIREEQFQVVKNLIKRQDSALEQLEALSERIEQAINETIASRELINEESDAESLNLANNAAA